MPNPFGVNQALRIGGTALGITLATASISKAAGHLPAAPGSDWNRDTPTATARPFNIDLGSNSFTVDGTTYSITHDEGGAITLKPVEPSQAAQANIPNSGQQILASVTTNEHAPSSSAQASMHAVPTNGVSLATTFSLNGAGGMRTVADDQDLADRVLAAQPGNVLEGQTASERYENARRLRAGEGATYLDNAESALLTQMTQLLTGRVSPQALIQVSQIPTMGGRLVATATLLASVTEMNGAAGLMNLLSERGALSPGEVSGIRLGAPDNPRMQKFQALAICTLRSGVLNADGDKPRIQVLGSCEDAISGAAGKAPAGAVADALNVATTRETFLTKPVEPRESRKYSGVCSWDTPWLQVYTDSDSFCFGVAVAGPVMFSSKQPFEDPTFDPDNRGQGRVGWEGKNLFHALEGCTAPNTLPDPLVKDTPGDTLHSYAYGGIPHYLDPAIDAARIAQRDRQTQGRPPGGFAPFLTDCPDHILFDGSVTRWSDVTHKNPQDASLRFNEDRFVFPPGTELMMSVWVPERGKFETYSADILGARLPGIAFRDGTKMRFSRNWGTRFFDLRNAAGDGLPYSVWRNWGTGNNFPLTIGFPITDPMVRRIFAPGCPLPEVHFYWQYLEPSPEIAVAAR